MNFLKISNRINLVIGKLIPTFIKTLIKDRAYKVSTAELFKNKKNPVINKDSFGLSFIGPLNDFTGIGEAYRSNLQAMKAVDLPCKVIDYSLVGKNRSTFQWQEGSSNNYSVNLFHMNPDVFPQCLKEVPLDYWKNSYNIGWWVWELENIPKSWTYSIKLFDEIWVPSRFNADAIQRATDKKVTVVPISISEPTTLPRFNRDYFNLPEKGFLFLSMYDTDSCSYRKNPTAAIDSFLKTFSHKKDVFLILKIKQGLLKTDSRLKNLIEKNENIILLDKLLSREELNGLYQCIDCYISLHRSEGYGLTMAEAMINGVPCIGTNWSGNVDFMDTENSLLVDYKLIPVGKNYLPGTSKQRWAEADTEQVGNYMKEIYTDRQKHKALGERARKSIEKNLSHAFVGDIMQKRLNEIYGK